MTERYSSQIENPDALVEAPQLVTIHPGVARSEFYEDEELCIQEVGYTVTKPINLIGPIKRVVIMTSQWSEYADRAPQRDRSTAISATSSIVTICLDMLGQSPNSDPLTRPQRKAMLKGDWSLVGEAMWNASAIAACETGFSLDEVEVILVGPSQGGAVVSAMAATKTEKQVVSDVVLFNSASIENVDKRTWVQLGEDFVLRGGTDYNYYANLNPEWAYKESSADMLRIVKKPRGHFPLPIKAMAAANDAATLYAPLREKRLESRVNILHSELDVVSAGFNNRAARDYLQRIRSAEIREEEFKGEFHAISNHLPSLAVSLDTVINAQN